MNLLCFALGFTACALITWAFTVYLRGRPEPRSGNPRVCKYCGCADPFTVPDEREHRPERDPGLRP